MARVSADTLRTRSSSTPASEPAKRGRRPTNGNAAQAPRSARQQELPATGSAEPEEPGTEEVEIEETVPPGAVPPLPEDANTDELPVPTPQPAAKQTRGRRAAPPTLDEEQQDLIALGKLTRFALEEGMPIDDCVERFRAMVEAYDRHVVR